MRILLHAWFVGPLRIHDQGFLLTNVGEPTILRLSLDSVIADADALRALYSLKGTAGVRPCPMCRNVLKSGYDTSRSDYVVGIGSCDTDRFDAITENEYYVLHDALGLVKEDVNKKQFEAAQIAAGLSYNAVGLISDVALRVVLCPTRTMRLD